MIIIKIFDYLSLNVFNVKINIMLMNNKMSVF